MRIAYLSAGAGSLRCGACAHDFLQISRLRQLAHEVRVVPVYTPVHTDLGEMEVDSPVFLGGISSYLRVRRPALNRVWRVLRPVLDSTPVLEAATRRMVRTHPRDLGELTHTVIQGIAGPHASEITRLVEHLKGLRPEVVYLTNSLLAPLAGPVKSALDVAVVSGFLGEDSFIMDLPEPYRQDCITLLRAHAREIDALVCTSQAAAQQASLLLHTAADRVRVVRAPVEIATYARTSGAAPVDPPTVGYLSAVRPSKGLDLLLLAVHELAERDESPLKVLIAGQLLDGMYLKDIRRLIDRLPQNVTCQMMGDISLEEKVAMLRRCTVMVVPSRIAETRAMAAMEAMAAGVPVICPAHGSFPELLSEGGGWLYEPGNTAQIAQHLATALTDPEACRVAGAAAASAMLRLHTPELAAQELEFILNQARHIRQTQQLSR